jgi:hypothetical protein
MDLRSHDLTPILPSTIMFEGVSLDSADPRQQILSWAWTSRVFQRSSSIQGIYLLFRFKEWFVLGAWIPRFGFIQVVFLRESRDKADDNDASSLNPFFSFIVGFFSVFRTSFVYSIRFYSVLFLLFISRCEDQD